MRNSMIAPLAPTASAQESINFLTRTAIPFYQNWHNTFNIENYKITQRNNRNLEHLIGYCDIRISAFEALIENLKDGEEHSLQRFNQLIQESDAHAAALE